MLFVCWKLPLEIWSKIVRSRNRWPVLKGRHRARHWLPRHLLAVKGQRKRWLWAWNRWPRPSAGRTWRRVARLSRPFFGRHDISDNSSLYYKGDEISKDSDYGTRNEHEYQNPGNPLFQIGVLTEEMTRIEQETYQEYDPENNRKNGTDGIGYLVDGILDSPDLSLQWQPC